ncbi:MAG: hypothetical protein J2P41_13670 [Blastocatellia bacterium]|nr:hypothetical protein [Blastocatellia bacterium]
MKIDDSEVLIKSYLLGQLAEPDQTAFERELLCDREKYEQLWSIENDLIDSYVRGDMSCAERTNFERNYLTSPPHRERVAIARLFLECIDRTAEEMMEVEGEVTSWWRQVLSSQNWLQPIFIGVLVLVIFSISGTTWALIIRARLSEELAHIHKQAQVESQARELHEQEMTSRTRELGKELADGRLKNEQLESELERLHRPAESKPSAVNAYLLKPGHLRGGNASPRMTILRNIGGNPLTGLLRLLLPMGSRDYNSYRIKLQTVKGREIPLSIADQAVSIISSGNEASLSKGSDGYLDYLAEATIPTAKLNEDDYIVILYGRAEGGKSDEIERYPFQVRLRSIH